MTGPELHQRLPKPMGVPENGKIPLRMLDEQVETLLSDTAKAESRLVEWLSGDIPDKWQEFFANSMPSRGVREHDLVQAKRTLKLMLLDEDVKNLRLHSRGPAAWLWKAVLNT